MAESSILARVETLAPVAMTAFLPTLAVVAMLAEGWMAETRLMPASSKSLA